MKRSISLSCTALAASSLSMGLNAGVIYQDVNLNVSNYNDVILDVNSDGLNDLRFDHNYSSYYSSGYRYSSSRSYGDLWAYGLNGTQVVLGDALDGGDTIDDTLIFGDVNHMADYNRWYSRSCGSRSCSTSSGSTQTGTWNDGTQTVTGYLGFALSVDVDELLFGWVDITMQATGYSTIHGFGYENVANTGILAGATSSDHTNPTDVPEPSTLALLAFGATGLAAARRRQKKS